MVDVYLDRLCACLVYDEKHSHDDSSHVVAFYYRYIWTLAACGGHFVGHFDSGGCINRYRGSSGSVDGRIRFCGRYR